MKEVKKVEIFYPSFSKKALTFTIDDGNIPMDEKLLSILKPVGIKGTFNLCSDRLTLYGEDFYRDFYDGYGIANHCKHHPYCSHDGVRYVISDDRFDEESADPSFIYPVENMPGFYYQRHSHGWRIMVFEDTYISFIEDGKRELESVFGLGSVSGYVWPYREQDNDVAKQCIARLHGSARKTGATRGAYGFNIPEDKYAWSYNADHSNLLDTMAEYEAYPDDGQLKFFAFGVHSIDFEKFGKWGDLEIFAEKYGNRPDEFWYATVDEIFGYEKAVSLLEITGERIYNPASVPVYVKIYGEKRVLYPEQAYSF